MGTKVKFGWIVTSPRGDVLWYTARYFRRDAHWEAVDSYNKPIYCGGTHNNMEWRDLYRQGYRAVKFGIGCIDTCDTLANHA